MLIRLLTITLRVSQVALFLSPRFKALSGISVEDKNAVFRYVETEMDKVQVDRDEGTGAADNDSQYSMMFSDFEGGTELSYVRKITIDIYKY